MCRGIIGVHELIHRTAPHLGFSAVLGLRVLWPQLLRSPVQEKAKPSSHGSSESISMQSGESARELKVTWSRSRSSIPIP